MTNVKNSLGKFILKSEKLNPSFLLSQIRNLGLEYEEAILHGKLNEHNRALDILVNRLHDTELAERYCDDIAGKNSTMKATLLGLLLSCYLNPIDQNNKDKFTVLAIELLNKRSDDMNGHQALSCLPEHWNISVILPALRKICRNETHTQRMTSVAKHLHKGENIQLRNKLISLTREPIEILPDHYCVVCKKGFDCGAPIGRYPNGVTLHQACISDVSVCPVTGSVFNITA